MICVVIIMFVDEVLVKMIYIVVNILLFLYILIVLVFI